ncbi:MAG: HAD-IA family hydrolase [Chloroflexi bacterium]|nr:HAD-IA family hydrolase [Chloroflexota bacterium]
MISSSALPRKSDETRPRIYQRTLARLGRQPAEAVFIDDFAHNIQAAQELGMATIHFKPGTNVPAELATLGVSV